jgi:hypothetical protein
MKHFSTITRFSCNRGFQTIEEFHLSRAWSHSLFSLAVLTFLTELNGQVGISAQFRMIFHYIFMYGTRGGQKSSCHFELTEAR